MSLNSERNKKTFDQGSVFVGYLLAGYPSRQEFLDIVSMCDESKMDVFEIGLPSKNPYADGKVIQEAHQKVDKNLTDDIEYFRNIRAITNKSIWLMGYYEEFVKTNQYLEYAKAGVADAFVIPDIPFDERCRLKEELNEYKADILGFTNPKMTDSEMIACFEKFDIVYEQLHSGPTGTKGNSDDYIHMYELSKAYSGLIKVAGFGISTKEKCLKLLEEGFDGAIIGTEVIRQLNESVSEMLKFINDVGEGIKR